MNIKHFNFKTASIELILKTVDDKSRFLSLYKSALKQILENPECNKLLKRIYKFDKATFEHSVNVSLIAAVIYYNENLPDMNMIDVINAGLFHDVGKTMINKKILLSSEKLSQRDKKLISLHPSFGYNMLSPIPMSNTAKKGVLYHHCNIKGKSYPMKINDREIPIIGRLLKIADVFDALISKRSYKEAKNPIDVSAYILNNVDIQFDKNLISSIEKLIKIIIKEENALYGTQINKIESRANYS